MSFLAPLYVLGSLVVVLPIVFHLIQRRPRGQQHFSSLMFLSASAPRITRRSRLNHPLLLLLRSVALILLAIAFAFYATRGTQHPVAGIIMQLLSLFCLGLGLFVPVMTIVAFGNLPLLGPVVHKFQSKGIIETIIVLWETVWPVSLLIFVFSVLNPIVKTAPVNPTTEIVDLVL